jgi:imidazolonepropionase-like amidohydrolase
MSSATMDVSCAMSQRRNEMSRSLTRAAAAALFLSSVPCAALAGDGRIVIKAGRVITLAGAEIEKGVIVIEEGRIKSVTSEGGGSWDAETLDHPELVAMPGWVEAHSIRGMDRPNENIEIAPFLDVRDSIDPINFYFEDCLRQGVLAINVQQGDQCTVGGQGRVVKPFGLTVDDMTIKPSAGLKLAAARPGRSRALQAQSLRRAFRELRAHLEKLVQDKKDGKDTARREALFQGRDMEAEENKKGRAMEGNAPWKVADFEIVPRGEVDAKQEPLLRLIEGRLMAFVSCNGAGSVTLALDVARENGFLAHTVLVLEGDAWKAADLIAEAGVPVVLGPTLLHVERDPLTGKEIQTFVPGVMREKKIRFALQSLNPAAQSLWFQAATCVGYGIPRDEAMAAATRIPAEMLRLGDRLGTLEPGKDGNVVLYDGDPLSVRSTVQYVVLDGNLVYDRSKDTRVRQLLEGVEQPNAAPADGGEDEDVDPHSGEKKPREGARKKD